MAMVWPCPLAVDAYVPGCFTKRPMSPESVVVKIVVRMSGGEALRPLVALNPVLAINGQFAELLTVPQRHFAVVSLSNAGPDGIPFNQAVVGRPGYGRIHRRERSWR